jgi:hypothetical protein
MGAAAVGGFAASLAEDWTESVELRMMRLLPPKMLRKLRIGCYWPSIVEAWVREVTQLFESYIMWTLQSAEMVR